MNPEELNQLRKERNLTYNEIAKAAGIPLSTVQKVLGGITKTPRGSTLRAIEYAIRRTDGYVPGHIPDHVLNIDMIRESTAGYSASSVHRRASERYTEDACGSSEEIDYYDLPIKPYPPKEYFDPPIGPYTLDDYYRIPDDIRVELIDGYFYNMSAPTVFHQDVIVHLLMQLYQCMKEHCPEGRVLGSPVDVRLDKDNKTMVQPDIIAFTSMRDVTRRCYNGAPDFALEVLSPSSRSHDMHRKAAKYMNAGVREYWIIDPDRRKVIVQLLEDDYEPHVFPLSGTIPVAVSKGKCSVDLDIIKVSLDELADVPEGEETEPTSTKKTDPGASHPHLVK